MPVDSAFDMMATTYDSQFTTSVTGRAQRRMVWKWLMTILHEAERPLKILEINCGTGEDAIRLAGMGHHVIATDASFAMIEKAREKIIQINDPDAMPEFRHLAFDGLKHQFETEQFDLVFSNFGGLNCIDKTALCNLANDLSFLTGRNGKLFLVLMSRYCFREILYYFIRAKFKIAFRRLRQKVNFNILSSSIPVYYYSPRLVIKIFSNSFQYKQKYPIGLFLPPSYLEENYVNNRKKLSRLEKLENMFGYPLLAGLADHYCLLFNKTGDRV